MQLQVLIVEVVHPTLERIPVAQDQPDTLLPRLGGEEHAEDERE